MKYLIEMHYAYIHFKNLSITNLCFIAELEISIWTEHQVFKGYI